MSIFRMAERLSGRWPASQGFCGARDFDEPQPSLKLFDEALEASNLVIAGLDNDGHVAHQAVQKIDVRGQALKIEAHERV